MFAELKLAVFFVLAGVATTVLGVVLLFAPAAHEMRGMGWPLVIAGPAAAVLGVVVWPRAR